MGGRGDKRRYRGVRKGMESLESGVGGRKKDNKRMCRGIRRGMESLESGVGGR